MSNYASVVAGRSHSNDQGRAGEMKRELSEMGMYEPGMTPKEMQEMLSAVNESKLTEEMSRTNSSKRLDSVEFSSPEKYEVTPSRETSPELLPETRVNITPEILRSRDSSEKETATLNYVMTPSPVRSDTSTLAQNESQNNNMKKKQSKVRIWEKFADLWQLNPLDWEKAAKDEKLAMRDNIQSCRPTIRFKIGDELPENVIRLNYLRLIHASNEFYKNHPEYRTKIEWGAPIKIPIEDGPSSKESRPVTLTSSRQQVNVTGTRSNLRTDDKSQSAKQPTEDEVYNFSDDNNFELAKKRAKPSTRSPQERPFLRKPRTKANNHLMTEEIELQDPNGGHLQEKPSTSRKRPLLKSPEPKGDNSSQEFDVIERPVQQQALEIIEVTEEMYPRRVIPPNVLRSRGRRQGGGEHAKSVKNLLENRSDLTIKRIGSKKMKEDALTEQQIETMITDDEDEPIIGLKFTGKRATNALMLLESAKKQEENENQQRQDAERLRRERIEREREEKLQENIRKEHAFQRAKEAIENREKQKNAFYRSGIAVKTGKRPELDGEQARNPSVVEVTTRPKADTFVDLSPLKADRVQCPICLKWFSEGQEVETHADNCSDYQEADGSMNDVEEIERTSSADALECKICNRFRCRDGHEYENHVAKCLVKARQDGASGSNSMPMNVPNSPIRSYQPLSSIKNPTIDYRGQTNSRTQPNRNSNTRKRRKI